MTSRVTRLHDTLWPAHDSAAQALRFVVLLISGSLILAFSARVQIPLQPVPFTMQVLAVLLISGIVGSRLGAATVATYLALGAMGMPYFSKPEAAIGFAYFFGPTGGYLIGFLFAAYVAGLSADCGLSKKPFSVFAFMALGALIILALGTTWLALTAMGGDWEKAFTVGFAPFVLLDLVKAALATACIAGLWSLAKTLKG